MTGKNRGIRLKNRLDPEDLGQQKLLQVTFSQLAAARHLASPPFDLQPTPHPWDLHAATKSDERLRPRRRMVARMLRVELEATLAQLDQALERARASALNAPHEEMEQIGPRGPLGLGREE